jgi:hypothetical protein
MDGVYYTGINQLGAAQSKKIRFYLFSPFGLEAPSEKTPADD